MPFGQGTTPRRGGYRPVAPVTLTGIATAEQEACLTGYDAGLADRVASAAEELAGAPALDILAWAVDAFGDKLVVTSSMQDAVLVDLASRVKPGIAVMFLDTGYHFAETLGMRDAVAAVHDIDLVNVTPPASVEEQDREHGPALYSRDPDLCCAMRKVQPLRQALKPYLAWVTGLRRAETLSRRDARCIEWDVDRRRVKVNPIVGWSDDDVDAYVAERNLLVNPLRAEGYLSIGCEPCTRRVGPDDDARSGRWPGVNKQECGIHV
jgi:phosphoadenosine phosphosulfate reductase